MFSSLIRRARLELYIACLLMLVCGLATPTHASSDPQSFSVSVTGEGPPMLLIPGLASSGHVWDETVAHYKQHYTCHVVTLAGFGGEPPIEETPFLPIVRDALLQYIADEKLDAPVVVGHSLGGFMALWLAVTQPAAIGSVVVVDGLPYLAAAQNPAATSETMRPQAEQMRAMSASYTQDQFRQQQMMILPAMITDSSDVATVVATAGESNPGTVAQAMFELMTTDIRDDLTHIEAPTLVIGTWVAYKAYGGTRDQTLATFNQQYAKLEGADIQLSDTARHFVMYDDLPGMLAAMDRFLDNR